MNVKKMFAATAGMLIVASSLPVSVLGAASYSDELQGAYNYAYSKGITTMSSIDNANMYGELTRGQLAKMISNWAEKELGTKADETKVCSFADAQTAEGDLAAYVKKACQMGLMGQGITSFRPNDKVTRGEFGTTLSRAIWGTKYDGATPYYANHLQALKDKGIMTKIENPSQMEIRGYVMLMLQRTSNTEKGAKCNDPLVTLACTMGSATCPAECKDSKNQTGHVNTGAEARGDLNVAVADFSNSVKSVPMVGISIFNEVNFTASEPVTVNAVTLERVGLSSRSDIKGVWFEKDGLAVSSRGTVATDGKVTTNFNKGLTVKANEKLDLVVELSGSTAGSEIAFKFIGVDSTAKNSTFNTVTTTYRTANYTVAALDLSNIGGTGLVEYKLGNQKEFTFGQFRVANQAAGDDKNVFVKSISFRNNGTADLNSLLKNVKVTRDNKVVSKSISMDGRTMTVTLDDTINAGKSVIYTVTAEVASLERIGDTVQLELRKDRDFVAYEAATKFRTFLKNPAQSNSWLLKEYKVLGGRVNLANTAGFAKTVEAGSGSTDVVIADGTLNVSEPVKLPKIVLTGDAGVIRSLILEVGGSRYSASVNGNVYTFDEIYVNKTAPIKLLASLQAVPTASSVTFAPAVIGSSAFQGKGEYTNNSEDLLGSSIAGAVQIAKVIVKEARFTLKNQASTTQRAVINETSTLEIFKGEMVAPKGDINVTELVLTEVNGRTVSGSDQIDLYLEVDGQSVANTTYRGTMTGVVFSNIGTAKAAASKVVIKAMPTMTHTGDFTFAVKANGTDANGNNASTPAVNTVKLSVVSSSSASIANANATSQVVLEGTNAELTKFALTAKNGSINLTGLVLAYNGSITGMNGKNVTLEVGGDSYTATSTATGVVFNQLNTNLLEGTHNAVLTTNVNTDGVTGGVLVEVSTVTVKGDFPEVQRAIGSKYLFVKAFPTLSLVSAKDNTLVVRITNSSSENVTITDFTAVNANLTGTTLNGQSVTSPIPTSKQVTLAAGQSTDLKLSITAAGILKLTGLKYTVTDNNQTYEYNVTEDYTNVSTWGDLQTTYRS